MSATKLIKPKIFEGPYARKYVEYYDTGTPYIEIVYKEEIGQGTFVAYHPNGRKKATFKILDGKSDGNAIHYKDDGSIIALGKYKEGKRVGQWEFIRDDKLIKKYF